MRTLDTDRLMRLANALFPDDGELALYNAYIEAHSDALERETLEGPQQATDDPESEVIALLGFTTIGRITCRIRWAFAMTDPDQRLELDRIARAHAVVLPDDHRVSVPQPPHSLALLSAVLAPDGRYAYVMHRHPGIARDEAFAILAKMADPPADPTPPSSAPPGAN
jgi:hypothetical protein